jgi:hypothetical protein
MKDKFGASIVVLASAGDTNFNIVASLIKSGLCSSLRQRARHYRRGP